MRNFENDPRLKNMSPIKRAIIGEIMTGRSNASMETMLPEIMKINNELNKRKLSFTREESQLIIDIMMENASPAEKQKIQMLKSFL
ncbi:hypothetical protein DXB54_09475 [Coprococcus sp. OM04-5BH]|jgi:hypothetical protein|uniref:hypothetical protein n=1 Tax=Coprococcus sp. OM04-5BH TaxID=2293093 RepID=UPI000E4896D5|nr:hypothetical protein [Coprococcus sp. OM04-5BH]RHV30991.1 hypothetical protein DXB54_09475 [Coprococcus sp. OM04-5BH]